MGMLDKLMDGIVKTDVATTVVNTNNNQGINIDGSNNVNITVNQGVRPLTLEERIAALEAENARLRAQLNSPQKAAADARAEYQRVISEKLTDLARRI